MEDASAMMAHRPQAQPDHIVTPPLRDTYVPQYAGGGGAATTSQSMAMQQVPPHQQMSPIDQARTLLAQQRQTFLSGPSPHIGFDHQFQAFDLSLHFPGDLPFDLDFRPEFKEPISGRFHD